MKNLNDIIAAAQNDFGEFWYRNRYGGGFVIPQAAKISDFLATSIRKAVEESFKATEQEELNRRDQTNEVNIAYQKGFLAALRAVEEKKKELLK